MPWTQLEDEFMKNNYGKMNTTELCAKLFELNGFVESRTVPVVRARARTLKLTDPKHIENSKQAFKQAEANWYRKLNYLKNTESNITQKLS